MIVFDDAYVATFSGLVDSHLKEALSQRWQCDHWCAFWPAIGRMYRAGGLMVVGRALNGWDRTNFDAKRPLSNYRAIVETCRDSFDGQRECPVSWVEKTGNSYNTNRSAFWRVTKRIAELIGPGGTGWASHICWNNLMRVSPSCGGNPPEWSYWAQLPFAASLLVAEVKSLKPSLVLVLAGEDWFAPFCQHLPPQTNIAHAKGYRYVSSIGHLGGSTIVVAPHPMGKKEDVLVADIRRAAHL